MALYLTTLFPFLLFQQRIQNAYKSKEICEFKKGLDQMSSTVRKSICVLSPIPGLFTIPD